MRFDPGLNEIVKTFIDQAAKKSKVRRFFAFVSRMFCCTRRQSLKEESNAKSDPDESTSDSNLKESDVVNSQPRTKTGRCKKQMAQKPQVIIKFSCFNNWSVHIFPVEKYQKSKICKKRKQCNALLTDSSDSDFLPAKTCGCKQRKKKKRKATLMFYRFNNCHPFSRGKKQKTKTDTSQTIYGMRKEQIYRFLVKICIMELVIHVVKKNNKKQKQAVSSVWKKFQLSPTGCLPKSGLKSGMYIIKSP